MSKNIEIHGFCESQYEPVKKAFAQNFAENLEVGASLAITVDGKYVIDIWAGFMDAAKTRPWEENTIVNVWSTTKIMTVISTLMLVDRGLLDLDAPVADYWPEFAQNGKENLPVRNIFSHTSGLAGWDAKITSEDLYDWKKVTELLAKQKPWWKPGTQSGYHGLTHGYLLGELVRRITGKSLGTFFKEEVADPLNADFHIGLSKEHDHRVGELIPPRFPEPGDPDYIEPTPIAAKMGFSDDNFVIRTKDREFRAAEIPAANGQGNARSVARVTSAVACGGEVDGIKLLSLSTIEKALEEQSYGNDLVLATPIRFGLGFGLPSKETPALNPRTCWWGGWGGSLGIMDLDARVSIGYVMNKMTSTTLGDIRTMRIIGALNSIN